MILRSLFIATVLLTGCAPPAEEAVDVPIDGALHLSIGKPLPKAYHGARTPYATDLPVVVSNGLAVPLREALIMCEFGDAAGLGLLHQPLLPGKTAEVTVTFGAEQFDTLVAATSSGKPFCHFSKANDEWLQSPPNSIGAPPSIDGAAGSRS